MKLRFSNGKDYATTFDACDLAEFRENGLAALRVYRAATQHRVHRGEIRKTVSEFEQVQLHVADNMGVWRNLGHIKSVVGRQFFDSFTIRFDLRADSLEDMHALDCALFSRSAKTMWQGAVDAWRWLQAFNDLVTGVGDALERDGRN